MTRSFVLSSSLAALMMVAGTPAMAGWVEDGVPACLHPAAVFTPVAVPDGSGGIIIAWEDDRNASTTSRDIYAQRVDADGIPRWTTNGVPISQTSGVQTSVRIASDGAGGAIVVWVDQRSDLGDIYAQRIDGSGNTLWAANGVPVCTATNAQTNPDIHVDGVVAVIAWVDGRNASTDIYVQRIDSNGGPVWIDNGVALCTASANQLNPKVTTDGAGGAIVSWEDFRSGDDDIYARAINFLGTPIWTFNGVPVVVNAGTTQHQSQVVSDGAGGAIVVWEDDRISPGIMDIYGQRLNYAGTPLWTTNGAPLCTSSGDQQSVVIAPDGAGGVFAAWTDYGSTPTSIVAQRMSPLGVSYWSANGILIRTGAVNALFPAITPTDDGGAVIAWLDDDPALSMGIYAQRIDALGTPYWGAAGAPVVTAPDYQYLAGLVGSDGGVCLAWRDDRGGTSSNGDVYAQRLELTHGYWGRPEPAITAVTDNPGDQGGEVALNWSASQRDAFPLQEITHYSVWRAVDPVTAAGSGASRGATWVSLADIGAHFHGDAFRVERTAAGTYYWEFVDTQDAIAATGYSDLVATRRDSTAGDPARHYFQVVAHTANPQIFFASAPDSGYSVDDLAPASPLTLAAMRAGDATVQLVWVAGSGTPDLERYDVYRSTTPGFVTDPAHFLMSATTEEATDPSASPAMEWHYKVVAVDVHGNRSGDSNEASVPITTAVGDGGVSPASFVLRGNTPNPFRTTTRLVFGMPSAGPVTFEVFDVAGHRVVGRRLPPVEAGWNTCAFDGRDDAGAPLPSGLYFYRVFPAAFPAAAQTRKMVIER